MNRRWNLKRKGYLTFASSKRIREKMNRRGKGSKLEKEEEE